MKKKAVVAIVQNEKGQLLLAHCAIICETGGKLAHLAVVGREYDVTILLVPNALKLYNENQYLTVDLINNQITLIM